MFTSGGIVIQVDYIIVLTELCYSCAGFKNCLKLSEVAQTAVCLCYINDDGIVGCRQLLLSGAF